MRKELPKVFIKTIKHFFPDLSDWLSKVKDKRDQSKILYSKRKLLWEGLSLYVFKIKTRRSINYRFNTEEFVKNISFLVEEDVTKISHHDTLNNFLKKVDWEELEECKYAMINTLIRNKVLEKERLFGNYYAIAIDGTGMISFSTRHCDKCLTRKLSSGEILYYHNVVEAKLVTPSGLALSIATDFMENMPSRDKQVRQGGSALGTNCELTAFKRLAPKIKKMFPQLKICMLGDALYAVKPVFDICNKYNWNFIFTFKEGRSSDIYSEYGKLKNIEDQNRLNIDTDEKIKQEYAWVNGIDYQGLSLNVTECVEYNKNNCKTIPFVYITNFMVNKDNCCIISQGGRLRHKIENQGFNTQKNEGYNLEHVFSIHPQASKNFYMLMQIAHLFNQLFERGSLLKNVKQIFGSIENLTRELLETFRNFLIDKNLLESEIACSFQIRIGVT